LLKNIDILIDQSLIDKKLEKIQAKRKKEKGMELKKYPLLEKKKVEIKINQKKKKIKKEKKEQSDFAALIADINKIKTLLAQATKYKKEIEKLTELTFEELIKVRKLTNMDDRFHQRSESKEIIKERKEIEEKVKYELEREIEKLRIIKKLTETSKAPEPEKKKPEPEKKAVKRENPFQILKNKEPEIKTQEEKETKKILIIENDPMIIKLMSYFLKKENYSIFISIDGEDGLKSTLKEKPDIILLDIMMPVMNGFQFIIELKKDKAISNIPVVILSPLSREKDARKELEKGARDYITKPFSPQALLAKIKKNI